MANKSYTNVTETSFLTLTGIAVKTRRLTKQKHWESL